MPCHHQNTGEIIACQACYNAMVTDPPPAVAFANGPVPLCEQCAAVFRDTPGTYWERLEAVFSAAGSDK